MSDNNSLNAGLTTPQKRWRVRVLTATWFSYVGYYFCRKGFGVLKPAFKEIYHFTNFDLALIWTSFLIAYMLGQFLSAWLGGKKTSRFLLLAGMGISIVANFAFGVATLGGKAAFYWLLSFMIINGFAQATGWPGNVGLLAKWSRRRERGRIMAIWGTCYQLGSIIAKHFAALMLAYFGLAWSFWGASLVFLAIWILFYFWGPEQPEDVGLSPIVEEIVEDDESSDSIDQKSDHPNLPKQRTWSEAFPLVIAMGIIYFCFKFLRYALDSWSSTLLKESFNISTTLSANLSVAFDWIGFLGVIVGGYVSDKYFRSHRTPVIFYMTFGMFIGTTLLLYVGASSLWLFVSLLGMIGFMLMGPDSLLSGTAAMDVSTKEMAIVASGIINGLGSIGPIVQELLIGYLMKDQTNDNVVFVLLFGISILAVIGTFLLWYKTKKSPIPL